MKIRSHRELDVYKLAFDTSMNILNLQNHFLLKKSILYQIKLDDLLDRYVRILRKHFEKENTRNHLFQNFRIQKLKQLNHKYG